MKLPRNTETLRISRGQSIIHLVTGVVFSAGGFFVLRLVLAKGGGGLLWLWGAIWFLGSGTALCSGIAGLIRPGIFAVLDSDGVEFRSARIRRIPWRDFINARLSLRTINKRTEIEMNFRTPITLVVRAPSLLKGKWGPFKFTHEGHALPDGTAEILLRTAGCPITSEALIQKLSERIGVIADLRPADPKTETLGGVRMNQPPRQKWAGYFGACLFLFVGLTIAVIGVSKMHQARASRDWLPVNAEIVAAKVEIGESDNGKGHRSKSYTPNIRYRYVVGDRTFTSSRAAFIHEASASKTDAFLRRYPIGSKATAYYDPHDPKEAVLTREGAGFLWIFVAFGSVFTAIGCFLFKRLLSAREETL